MTTIRERILVLDDEPSILELLGQLLTEVGYDCTLTTSGQEALALLEKESFALLITDLKMPEMHGNEVVRQAKNLRPELAVIVVTALLEVTNAIESLRSGADDYLLKPFNMSEISLAVEKAIERRRLIIENRRYQQELEDRVAAATEELKSANAALNDTKEYLENLINSSVDGILTLDKDAKITFANFGAAQLTGYDNGMLMNMNFGDFFAGGLEEARHAVRMVEKGKPLQNYETEFVQRNGEQLPVNLSLSLVLDADGKVVATLAICKDITPQKRLEHELKEMSIKDSLTGLYNQRHFYDRLESEIERARRQKHPLSLLLFDIDQFKTYNDCHGHLEGDRVLRTVGEVVIECTREHVDLGFRYGGDEFTVILPEADETQASTIAERIRASFEAKRFDHLTLSVGLMSYKHGSSVRTFIRFTDAMMYDAKRSGGNRVYIYKQESTDDAGEDDLETGQDSGHEIEKEQDSA